MIGSVASASPERLYRDLVPNMSGVLCLLLRMDRSVLGARKFKVKGEHLTSISQADMSHARQCNGRKVRLQKRWTDHSASSGRERFLPPGLRGTVMPTEYPLIRIFTACV